MSFYTKLKVCMTYQASMIGELPNPSEKQIFQKHVDEEKNRTYTASKLIFSRSPLRNNSNPISFYFLRHVIQTCMYDCKFSACDLQLYLLVVSFGGVLGGFYQKIHCMLKLEAFHGACDKSLCVRCIVKMDFSCFP